MGRVRWQIDVKSMLVGFLLALVAALLLSGRPGRAQEWSGAIAADDQGVYIMNNGSVRYVEKQKCLKECRFYQ
jgi:hypothetical protein